jgi:Fe-S cluster assembly protein SufD
MSMVKAEAAPYLDAFRATPRGAGEPAWLTARREAALAHFGALGYPSRREEAWRFTDLRPLQRGAFPASAEGGAASPERVAPYRLAEAGHRLVFVNGRFAPALSALGALPSGAWLAAIARTAVERPELLEAAFDESDTIGAQPFAALNAALFADGFVLALAPGVVLDAPVEILHLGGSDAPHSYHLRNVVQLGAGSRARLVETFTGEGAYWTNVVTAVDLADGARLDHVKLQDEGVEALHFGVTRARLGNGAQYDSFLLALGARLSRQDIFVRLDGERALLGVNGAYLLRGEQEATAAILVDHAAAGGTTRETWKGVVDDRAHGVFLGTIRVRPDAQKTDARQLNKNLLLSPRAAVDTKPELEILADDVKCSHGATVGDLDEAALFYLRSRGIAEAEARRLLVEAFAVDAIDTVADAALRLHLTSHLRRWLGRRGE